MSEPPVVNGLMVCESVITDATTRNTSIINRFTTLKLKAFPAPPRKVAVFAALSNGQGRFPFRVLIDPLNGDGTLYQFSTTIDFPDPLQEIRFILNIPDLVFEEPGAYDVQLFGGSELLASIVIRVHHDEGGVR
jgi:hypothetical protein